MTNSKRWLLAGCASIAAMIAYPAFAQPAASTANADQPEATNDPDAPLLSDVQVTVERRTQSVQDTPLAVTAFTDKVRENIGIATIQDLAQFTPGLSYNAANDRPTIRGVGRQTNNHGINSPVANYIDGVYTSSVQDTSRRPIFVERNEILRGPQGALSGKGSSAGAINTFTKRPRKSFEAELGGFLNNYERSGLEGTITGPISDDLRYRVNMARYVQTKGYFHNVEDDSTEGDRFGTRNLLDLMLEGSLGSHIDFFMKGSTVDYQESLHDGGSFAPVQGGGTNPCQPNPLPTGLVPPNTTGLFDLRSSPTGCGLAYDPQAVIYGRGIKQNPVFTNPSDLRAFISNFKSDLHLDGYFNLTQDWTYHFSGVDLRYIGAWQRYTYTQLSDADGSPVQNFLLPANAFGTGARRVDANGINRYREAPNWYSNEVTLTSTGDGKFNWILGGYQFNQVTHQSPQNLIYSGFDELNNPVDSFYFQTTCAIATTVCGGFTATGVGGPAAIGGRLPVQPNARPFTAQFGEQVTDQDSWATFGQADYKFNDKWQVTIGARYNSDKEAIVERTRIISNGFGFGANNLIPVALDSTATSAPGFQVVNPATTVLEPGYRLVDITSFPTFTAPGSASCGVATALLAPTTSTYRNINGVIACANPTGVGSGLTRALLGPGVDGLSTVDPVTGDRVRSSHGKWQALTGSIGINYTPDDDTLIYFRFARGYRPGGFGSGTAGFLPLNPYTDKELLDSYELGAKFTLFNKLQVNTAVFRYDYTGIQAGLTRFERCLDPLDFSTCSATGVTVNLPSAINQGFEVEGLWYVTNDFQIVLNYSYLDAHIKNGRYGLGFEYGTDPAALLPTSQRLNAITCSVPSATCIGGLARDSITLQPRFTQDLSGNPLPNAPKNKIAANANYTLHFDAGTLTASVSYIWRDKSLGNLFGDVRDITPEYEQTNARLVWREKGNDYQIIAFAQNIFNQDTFEGGGITRRGSGLAPGQTGAQSEIFYQTYSLVLPRVVGIEVLKRFR